jgi:Flp pilus assembly pilin Flp
VKSFLNRVWKEDEGVLTFEWILLVTLLTIGVVGGISAVRDAILTELGDVSEAMISLDQSYSIACPWEVAVGDCVVDGATDSSFEDSAGMSEDRLCGDNDQGNVNGCTPGEDALGIPGN